MFGNINSILKGKKHTTRYKIKFYAELKEITHKYDDFINLGVNSLKLDLDLDLN